jgi:thiol-disulfide isomerase/thioredoxin
MPKQPSPEAMKDREAIMAFLKKRTEATQKRSDLTRELYKSHPDCEKLPELMMERWQGSRIQEPADVEERIAEINAMLPRIKDQDKAAKASLLLVVATLQKNKDNVENAMPVVEEFISSHSKDKQIPQLLSTVAGFALSADNTALAKKTFERLVSDFPESREAKSATGQIKQIDRIGKPMDLSFTDAIKGSEVSIAALKGKVVVIDFWATWCGPCVAEMPKMKKLYSDFHDKGVEFIGVSLDQPKEEGGLDKLKEYVEKNEIKWPQYYQGKGWKGDFSTSWGINSIPRLFVVDANGNLANINARGKLEELLPKYLEKAKGVN